MLDLNPYQLVQTTNHIEIPEACLIRRKSAEFGAILLEIALEWLSLPTRLMTHRYDRHDSPSRKKNRWGRRSCSERLLANLLSWVLVVASYLTYHFQGDFGR